MATKPRFVTEAQVVELVHLYHLARVPLSGTPGYTSRYARIRQAVTWFVKDHPEYTDTAVYKDLDAALL